MSNTETRQITIIANHMNENVRIESDASTFAELKENQQVSSLLQGNVRVIVRETRNELSIADAKLPDGGFTLIVVADKVKSGADQYDEMDYHELRSECISRGFSSEKYNGAGATKNVMRAHLRDDDEERAEAEEAAIENAPLVDTEPESHDSDYDEYEDEYDDEEEYEDEDESELEEPDADTSDRFNEMRQKIEDSVSRCKSEVTDILEEYTDILPDSMIPDYSETVESIKAELGL